MDKKAFGKRLNQARKARGLTGEKLAELCSINATYLRQIEGGAKIPSLPIFISLCQNLKVSPNYLLKDILGDNEYNDISVLVDLLNTATPDQIRLATNMIKTAVEFTKEVDKN